MIRLWYGIVPFNDRPVAINEFLRRTLTCFLEIREHFLGMSIGLDVLENVLDLSIRSDNESRSGNATDFLAVHVLLLHNPESLGHFLVRVRQQGKWQFLFFLEIFLRFWRIWGDAKQRGAGFLNLSI